MKRQVPIDIKDIKEGMEIALIPRRTVQVHGINTIFTAICTEAERFEAEYFDFEQVLEAESPKSGDLILVHQEGGPGVVCRVILDSAVPFYQGIGPFCLNLNHGGCHYPHVAKWSPLTVGEAVVLG